MPRIDRRAHGDRLLAVGGMIHDVVKLAISRKSSGIKFANRETKAVAAIFRAVRVARARRDGHPDAQESRGRHPGGQAQRYGPALAVFNRAQRERLPYTMCRPREWIPFARPVLHAIFSGVRHGPGDPDSIDLERSEERRVGKEWISGWSMAYLENNKLL